MKVQNAICLFIGAMIGPAIGADDDTLRDRVLEAEKRRIETIQRIIPACVCVSDGKDPGGGSGVLFDARGYGLTNFHVVASFMGSRRGVGGLNDGREYPLEVLGVDVTGDVAVFKLTGRDEFPVAPLGDSAVVRVGDDVIAIGNPFALAADFTPTVTRGIVTGVNRWQGDGETLIYTDCIQTDASINPGNSGGPLFNSAGEVIGINGRISAEMHKYARGRFNVGLGYAIAINQIKRFIPHLRAGLLGQHGTLLATVMDDVDGVVFNDLYDDAPAWDAGIRVGNRLLRFGGRNIRSANQFASLLGTYPERWPVPISFESNGRVFHKVLRLESVTPPLTQPYVVPEDVNREAVKLLLGDFRRAVLGVGGKGGGAWTWSAERRESGGAVRSYRIEDSSDRKTVRMEVNADMELIRELRWDGHRIVMIDGDKEYAPDDAEAAVETAAHVLRWDLLANEHAWERPEAKHIGGDALVEIDNQGNIIRERALEVIEWTISDQASIRFGFEVATHLPAWIVVHDAPTASNIEIEMDDYRQEAGLTWAFRMRVKGRGLDFEETKSAMRVEQ